MILSYNASYLIGIIIQQYSNMNEQIRAPQIMVEDLSFEVLSPQARIKPDGDKKKILKRIRDFIDQIKKIWALYGIKTAILFFKQSMSYILSMLSERMTNSILLQMERAQSDIEQRNEGQNDPQNSEQSNERQNGPQNSEQSNERQNGPQNSEQSNERQNGPQNSEQSNERQNGPQRSQTQWLWWIVCHIQAGFLHYLQYHFGWCQTILQAFRLTATCARIIIGVCWEGLVVALSSCIAKVVNWFVGLFQ